MTINTLKEYHDLVQAVAAAAGISTEQATRATYTVLTVSGSDLIWTLSQRESFKSWLQTAAMYPPIISQWDIVGMIFYWLSLEGATWINDFKIQQPTNTTPGDLYRKLIVARHRKYCRMANTTTLTLLGGMSQYITGCGIR